MQLSYLYFQNTKLIETYGKHVATDFPKYNFTNKEKNISI